MIGGGDNGTLAAGQTAYYNPYGGGDQVAAASVDIRVPFDCIIDELRGNAVGAPGAGDTYTYTLMVEGAASALTCQTVNPNLESQDLVNQVSVSEDELICIRIVTSATATARLHRWSMKCIPTGA